MPAAASWPDTVIGSASQYRAASAVASWSQLANSGSSWVSISSARWANSTKTSRTCAAYSSADHTSGAGRRRTSAPRSTVCQEAIDDRMASATAGPGTVAGSNPHSGQGRSRVQVQSLSSVGGATGSSAVMRQIVGAYGRRADRRDEVSGMSGFNFRRTAMEAESPEEVGYGTIRANLGESSLTDRRFADLGVEVDDLVLFYGDHRGDPRLRALVAERFGLPDDAVLATTGGALALFLVATALGGPGTRTLVTAPNYVSNIETPAALGGTVDLLRVALSRRLGDRPRPCPAGPDPGDPAGVDHHPAQPDRHRDLPGGAGRVDRHGRGDARDLPAGRPDLRRAVRSRTVAGRGKLVVAGHLGVRGVQDLRHSWHPAGLADLHRSGSDDGPACGQGTGGAHRLGAGRGHRRGGAEPPRAAPSGHPRGGGPARCPRPGLAG